MIRIPQTARADRWQLAFTAAGAGAWEWNLATGVVHWSSALEALHHLPAGTFPGTIEALQAFIHPDDRSRVIASLAHGLDLRSTSLHLQYRIIRLDGQSRWVESRNRLIADERGKPIVILGLCFDITERRAEELRASRVVSLVDGFGDAVIALDDDWNVIYQNDEAQRLFGLSMSSFWSAHPELLATCFEAECRNAALRRTPATFDQRLPNGDWFEVHAYPSGAGLSVQLKNATLRKKAEELARRSREAFQLLVERSADGILMRSADTILFANAAMARVLGYPEGSALVGASVLSLVSAEHRGELAWRMSAVDRGEASAPADLTLSRRDGTPVRVELSESPLGDFDSAPAVATVVRPV